LALSISSLRELFIHVELLVHGLSDVDHHAVVVIIYIL
jgi:hypothetical protein